MKTKQIELPKEVEEFQKELRKDLERVFPENPHLIYGLLPNFFSLQVVSSMAICLYHMKPWDRVNNIRTVLFLADSAVFKEIKAPVENEVTAFFQKKSFEIFSKIEESKKIILRFVEKLPSETEEIFTSYELGIIHDSYKTLGN